eukprot:gene16461-34347_t
MPLVAGVVNVGVFAAILVYLLSVLTWVEHTERVIGNANEIAKLMVDQESGMRGFALTGDESFLASYKLAKPKMDTGLATLREMVADNPVQMNRVRTIAAQQRQWDGFAQEVIQRRRTGADYLEPIRAGRGKLEFDEVRNLFQLFVTSEQRLLAEPGVTAVSTWVGSGVPRFYLPLDQVFPQSNVSQFIVLPQDLKLRESLRVKLPGLLAEEFPEVRGRVKLLPNGPPVPYPVQFRVVGPDPLVLRERADEVKAQLRQNPDMRGVNDNWNESVKVLRLEVDQAKARALGVTSQSIAQASKTILSGTQVGQFREGDKLIDILLRQPLDERNAITDIANAYLPTASGKSIPLTQIAKPVFTWEPGVMWRENRDYAITVQGDIVEGQQGATVTAALMPQHKALEAKWQQADMQGYRIEVAGAVEESSKGSASIVAGVPIMLFLTFTLLMLQLQSFSRALLVFITGPLGIAGVAGALILLGRPFGFVALLGVIALMGMIQRNSVILIDQIEQDRAAGIPAWDAIVESAV